MTLFVFLTVLVLEADNDDKAGGVWCRGGSALPAIAASADAGSQFAALILDRYPRRVYGCAARRRGGRTKADVEREQRELLEKTKAEVDAIAAEFHERMPRTLAKRIGLMYARYSSRFQSSVAAQVRAMYEVAVREETFVPRELVFFDLAVRGYRDNRPGLNALRAALSNKQGHSLLVFGTNRLFRKAHRAVRFVEEEIVECGMRCFFIQQNIDTAANKDWRLHLMIQAAIDENGTSMYAENIRAAHQGMFLRLEVIGTLPLGYCGEPIAGAPPTRRGRPRCQIVIDKDEAAYVVKIFEWYVVDGKSMDEIAQLLNDDPNAPSPPKSLHGMWTHGSVRGVLVNARYRGYWEYGKQQCQYQSKQDYVRQVERDEPLQAAFFDKLRIISDKTWYEAQGLLLKEKSKRGRKPKDPERCARPKVLNGIWWCPEHDRPLQVGAGYGSAMICKLCKAEKREKEPLYSQLDRDLGLRLTLKELAKFVRVDERLVGDAVAACRSEAERLQRPNPERLEQLRALVARKTRAIQINRRNPGETDEDQRESDRIVKELRAERTRSQAEIAELEVARQRHIEIPDDEQMRTLLGKLETILVAAAQGDLPEDLRDIRRLVTALTGGRIFLYQMGERRPKLGWLQGRFRLRRLSCLVQWATGIPASHVEEGIEVTIDYRPPSPLDAKSDRAWTLNEQKLLHLEIAAELKCGKSTVTKLLRHAAARRGIPYEDGRSRRSSLARKHRKAPPFEQVAPEVGRLADQGLSLREIGEKLELDRTTLSKAYNKDRADRGLPPLDGRTRRKLLGLKDRPKDGEQK
ncbi:MAG TPA: recombinase family protein [Pirellulales bacterium]